MKNAKALFISHGGGPMPLLGDPGHEELVATLKAVSFELEKPEAIVVVSAHWEESVPTITAGANPPLIYDYYGFPEESYSIQYPCAGNPALAKDVYQMLMDAGIESRLDENRGFDHGLFIPLKILYPAADIPCIQLSLVNSLEPALHINMGRALRALSQRNVLLIGSGFSFHNMKAFFANETEEEQQLNSAFEKWLANVCSSTDYTEQQRTELLTEWERAEGARYCHPREEHLLPLHVCYGLAESSALKSFSLRILDKKSSMYLW